MQQTHFKIVWQHWPQSKQPWATEATEQRTMVKIVRFFKTKFSGFSSREPKPTKSREIEKILQTFKNPIPSSVCPEMPVFKPWKLLNVRKYKWTSGPLKEFVFLSLGWMKVSLLLIMKWCSWRFSDIQGRYLSRRIGGILLKQNKINLLIHNSYDSLKT